MSTENGKLFNHTKEIAKNEAQKNEVQANDPNVMEFRMLLQNFCTKLNQLPDGSMIDKTPDGNAHTVLISHIETLLDEYFFGLWSTENFKWSVIANEVVGSIDLVLSHPVTGKDLKRVGAGAIQIMVDKAPDSIKDDKQAKNRWSLDPHNKKPNALDMAFPKLKAECMKNAAISLGKLFGRDINRKRVDTYQPLIKPKWDANNNQQNPQQ